MTNATLNETLKVVTIAVNSTEALLKVRSQVPLCLVVLTLTSRHLWQATISGTFERPASDDIQPEGQVDVTQLCLRTQDEVMSLFVAFTL